jgi:hypothetical protein
MKWRTLLSEQRSHFLECVLTTAWCVLINCRLLAGGSPVAVRVRPPRSRQPVLLGD